VAGAESGGRPTIRRLVRGKTLLPRAWAVSSRPECEREQQTRLLKPTHRVRFAGIESDQRAVVAGSRVLAARDPDATAENLDEDAVPVPRITDFFVLCEVDQVNAQSRSR
jgi:hypothetical protein